jgi:hypothetical protein
MAVSDPTATRGSHNLEVAAGLRNLAAFLEDHPELPSARWASVSLRAVRDGQPARQTLELIADALGEAASERRILGGDVEIFGDFGPCRLRASASVQELADLPPDQMPYEPIIKPSGGELLKALDRSISDEIAAGHLRSAA